MKYSIILPVHNGIKYIKTCIESILQQSLQDFNLIVLDNNCTDGTTEFINSLNSDKIYLHRSEKTLTIEQNWARAISILKNEFMVFIGHDDLFAPEYLQAIDELIRKYPNATLYSTGFNYINHNGKIIRQSKPIDEKLNADTLLQNVFTNKQDVTATGFVMRSNDYNAIGGIPDYPGLMFADLELWLKLTQQGILAVAKQSCFLIRKHQSVTATIASGLLVESFSRFILFLLEWQKSDKQIEKILEENAQKFIRLFCIVLAFRILHSPVKVPCKLFVSDLIVDCKKLLKKIYHKKKSIHFYSVRLSMALLLDNKWGHFLYANYRKLFYSSYE